MKHEGGYACDPYDHGGETYRGISRKNWQGFPGWPDIDRMKAAGKDFPKCLDLNADLQIKVQDFYFRNFWTPSMEAIQDQDLANWLFDKGVNMGIRQAIKLLQRALNVDADGVIGPQTMVKLNAADPVELLVACRDQARSFYTKLALNDSTQTRFLHGWLARA
jgi:lysozyme family protein